MRRGQVRRRGSLTNQTSEIVARMPEGRSFFFGKYIVLLRRFDFAIV